MADSDGTISSRNSFPSPANAVTSLDGPKLIPVNSTTEWLGLSNTANTYCVMYRDCSGAACGQGEFMVRSYA